MNNRFFGTFKKRYSLQGIDSDYLNSLELRKPHILQQINNNNLADLYFEIFKSAQIRHEQGFREKDLGSFFAKLVHTFRPDDCSALDNPIKEYLGLRRESFFVAFVIISQVYREWATNNINLMNTIRESLLEADTEIVFDHERITDLKILDLIFWSKANLY